MAKKGRPVSVEPKSERVTVRFTEQEYKRLKRYVELNNLSITQTIKLGVEEIIKDSRQ